MEITTSTMQNDFPRLYDIVSNRRFNTTATHFNNWDEDSDFSNTRKKAFVKIENYFQQIEKSQWMIFKNKIFSCGNNDSQRGLSQFMDVCSEAEAYNYLKQNNCTDIQFIKESNSPTIKLNGHS